jgi:MYXO-CTERM domain-containing protein
MSGNANEANAAIGLLFGGTVVATATDGYTIEISLRFVPKQTQAPDVNDYTWNVSYGDSPANGIDTVGSALRFAVYFSRDDVIDATETPNTFQRYTQLTQNFVAGPDTFVNTDTTTAPIKDATDSGAPAGTDAVGRDLAVYFAWRDGGAISPGVILVDNFTFNGLLEANDATLVPEPSSIMLGLVGAALLFFWRRRR